jgi:hypothetical protein
MPTFLVSPLVRIALGALGAGAALHYVIREVRRLQDELNPVSAMPMEDASVRKSFPTLRRDPQTGDWRVS